MFEVNNKDTRTTLLGFGTFDSIRHRSISGTFKNMYFGKSIGDVVEKSYKN